MNPIIKTQCASSLTAHALVDADRLLRQDATMASTYDYEYMTLRVPERLVPVAIPLVWALFRPCGVEATEEAHKWELELVQYDKKMNEINRVIAVNPGC